MKSPPRSKTRILLVEDHQIVRQGIARIINQEDDMIIDGEASDAAAGIDLALRRKPDLVIADISLPGMNGIEFLKHLKAHHPDLPVVMLSMHDEALYAERALRAGALAYVMKKESSDEVLLAIRKACRGEYHVSEGVGGGIFQKFLGTNRASGSSISDLSDRELEVFELLGRGHGSREIAAELKISIKTVDTHRAHIKEKLRLKTTPDMIRHAVQWVERENRGS